jgi:thiamine transport system ATP-binding protein
MSELFKDQGAAATIELQGIRFQHRGGEPMHFHATIKAGDIVSVMGPSGSGKSTLLNLIAGFERPVEGRVMIDGEDVTSLAPYNRPVSMIFQENNLFAHLTVEQNVGLGRSPSLRLSASDCEAIDVALQRTGLGGKAKRLPSALSGGERQRVALARALVQSNPVLLLDEPLASLGPALRDEMLDLIADLHRAQPMTIVMVTHDSRDARMLSRSLLFVAEGHIVATGSTQELFGEDAPEAITRYLGARSSM